MANMLLKRITGVVRGECSGVESEWVSLWVSDWGVEICGGECLLLASYSTSPSQDGKCLCCVFCVGSIGSVVCDECGGCCVRCVLWNMESEWGSGGVEECCVCLCFRVSEWVSALCAMDSLVRDVWSTWSGVWMGVECWVQWCNILCVVLQPKQINDIRDFLQKARRKDAKNVKIKKAEGVVKFKIRCSKVCSVWCQCFFNFVLSADGGHISYFLCLCFV